MFVPYRLFAMCNIQRNCTIIIIITITAIINLPQHCGATFGGGGGLQNWISA